MKVTIEAGRYKGHIILPDFLTIVQVRAFEDSFGDINQEEQDGGRVWLSVSDADHLPAILSIVQEWHIENVPEKPTFDTFPFSPVKDAHEMVVQIFNAILNLWKGEEVPNA